MQKFGKVMLALGLVVATLKAPLWLLIPAVIILAVVLYQTED